MGFGCAARDHADDIHEAIRQALPHEFLGRIDAVVVFHPLTEDAVRCLWRRELATLERQLGERYGAMTIAVDALAERILLEEAWQEVPTQGARAVQKTFEVKLKTSCINAMADAGLHSGPWCIDFVVTPAGEVHCIRSRPGVHGTADAAPSDSTASLP